MITAVNSVAVVVLTIFLLLTIAAAQKSAQNFNVSPLRSCFHANRSFHVATATGIKKTLVEDLLAKAPAVAGHGYCNSATRKGLTMFGFAKCWFHDGAGCAACLSDPGRKLVRGCRKTVAGEMWEAVC